MKMGKAKKNKSHLKWIFSSLGHLFEGVRIPAEQPLYVGKN